MNSLFMNIAASFASVLFPPPVDPIKTVTRLKSTVASLIGPKLLTISCSFSVLRQKEQAQK